MFLAGEGGCLAAFETDDALRPGAAELVAALRRRGIEVHLASGDDPARAAALARRLGIGRWQGALRPRAKQDYVAALQDAGRVVAMVGDGLNDTPVLAAADVSFALGAGADAAQLRADVLLTANSLPAIVALVAGILILIIPRLLNFIVAIYLIFIGLVGLNSAHHWVNFH